MDSNFPPPDVDLREDQASRAFHTFVRGARRSMETKVWDRVYRDYQDIVGGDTLTADEALPVLDRIPAFQTYAWLFRNLQRFKYTYPDWGIVSAAEAERPRLAGGPSAAESGDRLSGLLSSCRFPPASRRSMERPARRTDL
jgi:hypothetical protein